MSDAEPVIELAILVALKEEAAGVRAAIKSLPESQQSRIRLAQGGVGAAMAASAAQKLAHTPGIRCICSTGFCGGLDPVLPVGGIFLPTQIVAWADDKAAQTFSLNDSTTQRVLNAFNAANLNVQTGTLATVINPVFKVEEKHALGKAAGAQGVDMESAAVARVTVEKNLEFFALRTVSDGANDALPDEVGTFLSVEGKVRIGNVTKFALGGPRNIRELWRLGQRSREATQSLEAAWKSVLPVLLTR